MAGVTPNVPEQSDSALNRARTSDTPESRDFPTLPKSRKSDTPVIIAAPEPPPVFIRPEPAPFPDLNIAGVGPAASRLLVWCNERFAYSDLGRKPSVGQVWGYLMNETLARWYPETKVSQTFIANALGLSPRSVTRALKDLEDAGFITRWSAPVAVGTSNGTNRDITILTIKLTLDQRSRLKERFKNSPVHADLLRGGDGARRMNAKTPKKAPVAVEPGNQHGEPLAPIITLKAN